MASRMAGKFSKEGFENPDEGELWAPRDETMEKVLEGWAEYYQHGVEGGLTGQSVGATARAVGDW